MDDKKEKPNWGYITIKAFISAIISVAVAVGLQWLSLESVVITGYGEPGLSSGAAYNGFLWKVLSSLFLQV